MDPYWNHSPENKLRAKSEGMCEVNEIIICDTKETTSCDNRKVDTPVNQTTLLSALEVIDSDENTQLPEQLLSPSARLPNKEPTNMQEEKDETEDATKEKDRKDDADEQMDIDAKEMDDNNEKDEQKMVRDKGEGQDNEQEEGGGEGQEEGQLRRRSTRLNKAGLDPETQRAIRESVELEKQLQRQEKAREEKDKKRREHRLSCRLCSLPDDKDGVNPVYSCSCGHHWHRKCAKPKLTTHRPSEDWRCPLCNHTALIAMLNQILLEFDALMEQVDQRRLAQMTVNRNISSESDTEEEVENREATQESKEPTVDRDVLKQVTNYCEVSSDEEEDRKEEDWQRIRNTCLCGGTSKCVYCKRLKGCTCDGAGTCRLCMSEEAGANSSASSSPELIIQEDEDSQTKDNDDDCMSTTELFLLKGESRPPVLPSGIELIPLPNDGQPAVAPSTPRPKQPATPRYDSPRTPLTTPNRPPAPPTLSSPANSSGMRTPTSSRGGRAGLVSRDARVFTPRNLLP